MLKAGANMNGIDFHLVGPPHNSFPGKYLSVSSGMFTNNSPATRDRE